MTVFDFYSGSLQLLVRGPPSGITSLLVLELQQEEGGAGVVAGSNCGQVRVSGNPKGGLASLGGAMAS